jgi:hypothetical protein
MCPDGHCSFSAGSSASKGDRNGKTAHIDHTARARVTSVIAKGSQNPMASPGRSNIGGGAGQSSIGDDGFGVSGKSPRATWYTADTHRKHTFPADIGNGIDPAPVTGRISRPCASCCKKAGSQ